MAPRTGISLCAGIGGLDLALERTIPGYRTVCYVERDAFCAAVLVARMADSSLAEAPIWDDLTTFDGRPWRDRVDLVSAGFPCQPFSVAGSRRGTQDHRWIWPDIARILGEVRPRYVFLENVRGILAPSQRDAFATVLGTLADLGMSARWGVFRASDTGAPHRRERWFLLAHTELDPRHEEPGQPFAVPATHTGSGDRRGLLGNPISPRWQAAGGGSLFDSSPEPVARGGDMGNPDSGRLHTNQAEPQSNRSWLDAEDIYASGFVGDPDRERLDGLDARLQFGRPLEVGAQAERPNPQLGWPPGPGCGPEDWPEGIPQPAIRRGADGFPYRVDQLRALGNAVVPAQAALAFVTLADPPPSHLS